MNDTQNKVERSDTKSDSSASADAGVISSRELLGSNKRLGIEHNGECYTLRITSNNKLILTK